MDGFQLISAVFGVYGELGAQIADEIYFRLTGERLIEKKTYEEKITDLMHRLSNASEEVDEVLREMQTTIASRATVVNQLEQQFSELSERKDKLEKLISDLEQQKLSHDVVRDFLGSVETTFEQSERRSSRQNLVYFIAGLLLSIPIGIGINLLTG